MEVSHQDILNEYRQVPEENKLKFIQSRLANTSNDLEKIWLKQQYELLLNGIVAAHKNQVVILLHGVNTLAPWQQTMKDMLESENIKVIPLSYGRYPIRKLFFPNKHKHEPVSEIKRHLKIIFKRHPDDILSVVAHSNGSFIISEILNEEKEWAKKISNVLLCGSIVKKSYPWEDLDDKLIVINEVGSSDVWPVMAEHISSQYSATGTFGFGGSVVNDRFHKIRHSDYLKIDFIKEYWLPFFQFGHVKNTSWGIEETKFPFIIELIHMMPSWLVYTCVVTIFPVLFLFICLIIKFLYNRFIEFLKKVFQ